eukprot:1565512-Rhodomonas_salina.1
MRGIGGQLASEGGMGGALLPPSAFGGWDGGGPGVAGHAGLSGQPSARADAGGALQPVPRLAGGLPVAETGARGQQATSRFATKNPFA